MKLKSNTTLTSGSRGPNAHSDDSDEESNVSPGHSGMKLAIVRLGRAGGKVGKKISF